MTLTKDQILEANDLQSESVTVPEWGGDVLVRTMTGADRDAFEASMITTLPDGAVLMADPEQQSRLIKQALFKTK